MTTKTKFLAAAAVLVLAIPVYSVLMDPADAPVETTPSAVEATLPASPGASDPVDPVVEAAPADRTEVVEPAVEEVTEVDPRALRVVVRDATTLEPVAGARVLYFDRASEKDRAWNADLFSRFEDTETLLERYGDAFETDEQGRVTLPARKSYAYVGARSGSDAAMTYLMEDPAVDGGTELELLLRPSVEFEVLVEDGLGRPVAHQRVEYQEVFGDRFAQWLTPAMTNDEGVARFRNLQDRLAQANPNLIHRIAVPIPGGVAAREFALDAPPEGRFTLRIPSTSAVRVLVQRPDGTPIPDGQAVFLQQHVEGDGDGDYPRNNALRGTQMVWIQDGAAVFERVALSTSVVAWIQSAGQRDAIEVTGMSAAAPGQEIELILGAPPEPTRVGLLVRDHEGNPVTDVVYNLQQVLLAEGVDPDPIRSRTGARDDGTVYFLQDRLLDESSPSPAGAEMMAVLVELAEGRARWGVARWEIVTEPGAQLAGEAVLGERLIASGLVFGADGQPMPFAELDLRVPAPWPQGEDDQIWMNFKADGDGRFEVRGTGLEEGATLAGYVSPPQLGSASSSSSTPIELIVGRTQQRVSMETQTRVRGRLLLDAGMPTELMWLRVDVTPAGEEASEHWIEVDPENGRFERGSLPEGAAQLVLTGSGRLELYRSAWFELKAGEAITPPDCDPLDLRGRLFVHRLRFEGPDGEKPAQVNAIFPDEGVGVSGTWALTLVTPDDQIRATFSAPGYRSVPARVIRGDETITLQAGVPVRFVLPEGVTLPAGEWEVHMRKLADDFGPGGADRRLAQSEAGVARWEGGLPQPGKYMLGLVRAYDASADESGPPTPVLWGGVTPFTNVEIADQLDPQTLTLELTQEELDAAGE